MRRTAHLNPGSIALLCTSGKRRWRQPAIVGVLALRVIKHLDIFWRRPALRRHGSRRFFVRSIRVSEAGKCFQRRHCHGGSPAGSCWLLNCSRAGSFAIRGWYIASLDRRRSSAQPITGDSAPGLTLPDGYHQGLQNQVGRHARLHRPAEDTAR